MSMNDVRNEWSIETDEWKVERGRFLSRQVERKKMKARLIV